MGAYHTVRQGEHLSGIAKANGFRDYRTIWDDPNNADLKQKRQNPNVLFPGDQLFIPDKEQRQESRNTGQRHRFKVRDTGLKLRLVLEDLYEKPIANAKCKLTIESETFDLTTDGEGKLEQEIRKQAEKATLLILDEQTPADGIELEVKIGHLDPVDKISGQKARLNNLGYFAGEFDDENEAQNAPANGAHGGPNSNAQEAQNSRGGNDESSLNSKTQQPQENGSGGDGNSTRSEEGQEQFRSAVEEFQCDHDLAVDGICGPMTQAKLKQVHGC
jgi:hypothetical protein